MYTYIAYYNDCGEFCSMQLDLMRFIETGTLPLIKKLFRSVVSRSDDFSIYADIADAVSDRLSEVETLIDMMEAENDTHCARYRGAVALMKRLRLTADLLKNYGG